MRRTSWLAAALAVAASACAATPKEEPAPAPAAEAPRDWSAPVDFESLRAEWAQRSDFSEHCEFNRPVKELQLLSEREDLEGLVELTGRMLQECPVDIQYHVIRAAALRQLGRQTESDQHGYWFRGLMDCVTRTGDGKSEETAFVVISVSEEYAVLWVLGLEPKSQAVSERFIDAIRVARDGREGTVYFNPKAHILRLQRKLDAPPP